MSCNLNKQESNLGKLVLITVCGVTVKFFAPAVCPQAYVATNSSNIILNILKVKFIISFIVSLVAGFHIIGRVSPNPHVSFSAHVGIPVRLIDAAARAGRVLRDDAAVPYKMAAAYKYAPSGAIHRVVGNTTAVDDDNAVTQVQAAASALHFLCAVQTVHVCGALVMRYFRPVFHNQNTRSGNVYAPAIASIVVARDGCARTKRDHGPVSDAQTTCVGSAGNLDMFKANF